MKRIITSDGAVVYVDPGVVELLMSDTEGLTHIYTKTRLQDYCIDLPIDDLAKQLGFTDELKPAACMQIPIVSSSWSCPSCGSILSDKDYQDRAHLDGPYAETLNTCAVCKTPLAQFKEIK